MEEFCAKEVEPVNRECEQVRWSAVGLGRGRYIHTYIRQALEWYQCVGRRWGPVGIGRHIHTFTCT
jgi:hypothetical protein